MISHREKEVGMGSLDKSLFILKRLGDPPYEFSLAELASFSGIGKSGAFKILKTLQKHNFVIQDFVTKKYHLSPIMIRLGNVYGRLKGIEEITKPVLSYISRTLGETTYITVWEGDRAFAAYKNVVRGGLLRFHGLYRQKHSPEFRGLGYGTLRIPGTGSNTKDTGIDRAREADAVYDHGQGTSYGRVPENSGAGACR
jgi:hypothetical protein